VLAIDFFEALDGFLVTALLVHEEDALVIELFGGLVGRYVGLLGEGVQRTKGVDPQAAAGAERRGQKRNGQQADNPPPANAHRHGYKERHAAAKNPFPRQGLAHDRNRTPQYLIRRVALKDLCGHSARNVAKLSEVGTGSREK
jgi:hypothetical protein